MILSFVLVVPYFSLFKVNMAEYEKYAWSEVVLADMLPKPESPYGEIVSNSETYMSLDVSKSTQKQYSEYIEACKEKGFTIDAETTGNFFNAYNDKGYKLSLSYYDYNDEINISLSAGKEFGTLVWSNSKFAQMLPIPESTVGEIQQDDEKRFTAYIGDTSIEDFNAYVTACESKGFSVDADKSDKRFTAKNADGYKLTVEYQGNNIIYISLDEPEYNVTIEIECVENLIFSKYDVDVYIDDSLEGTIEHGGTETIYITLTQGTYVLKFVSDEDDEVTGEVTLHIYQNESLKYKISCTSSGIDVDTMKGTTETSGTEESNDTQTTEIALTMGEDNFKGMNYKEAEKIFREMGFTSFEYRTVDTEDESAADTICYIEITEFIFGDSDFVKGDKFDADSTITFFSYKYEAPETPSPVFYSTNDYETAKKEIQVCSLIEKEAVPTTFTG